MGEAMFYFCVYTDRVSPSFVSKEAALAGKQAGLIGILVYDPVANKSHLELDLPEGWYEVQYKHPNFANESFVMWSDGSGYLSQLKRAGNKGSMLATQVNILSRLA